MRHIARLAGMALALSVLAAPSAMAQGPGDFFAALFGGFLRPKAPPAVTIMPGMPPDSVPYGGEEPRSSSGRGTAYCVRMCDGRYFPLSNVSDVDASSQCAAFCPKAETQVFRGGSSIDGAVSSSGRAYTSIPNAFRYRSKLDDACTCTGNGPLGLAAIPLKEDPTLRRGDVVMTSEGARVFDAKSPDTPHKDSDFVPVDQASRLSKDMKQRIEDLQLASGGNGRGL